MMLDSELHDDPFSDNITCSASQIKEDADCVYDFVLNTFTETKESDILVVGRSMGSGPSIHLASTRNPGGLICVSAYTSIKNVVNDNVGFLSFLVAEQFDNLKAIKKIELNTPVLLIHGELDTLVGKHHSEQLLKSLHN